MSRVASCLSVVALALSVVAGQALGQATIEVGTVEGSGSVSVTLSTGGNSIAGTENEIAFGPEVQLSNCAVNPAINRTASAFSYTPAGCTPGDNCSGVKALILSFTDLTPLPDGVVLYTCDVSVDAGAAPGDYALECEAPGASDPAGNSIDTDCDDGAVIVPDEPVVEIAVSSATGAPGGTVQIEISLNLLREGVEVAGTENVLNFAPETQIVECAVNPAIDRGATAFAFSPQGCAPGSNCSSVKALVLSFTNISAIPDGSVLYTCDVGLAGGTVAATVSGAAGTYPITCTEPGASDPDGNPLFTICSNGSVTIEEPATPTPQPTSTPTFTLEPTAPETPADTPTPVATNTPTNTSTNTPRPGGFDDDSCAIVSPQSSSTGWMLLLPMAVLLWARRRQR